MTIQTSPTIDFMRRLRLLENDGKYIRDVFILWAISIRGGMSGFEVAKQIGYDSRSNIQHGLNRLLECGYIEDHRLRKDRNTANCLHILPAGREFLAKIVPV